MDTKTIKLLSETTVKCEILKWKAEIRDILDLSVDEATIEYMPWVKDIYFYKHFSKILMCVYYTIWNPSKEEYAIRIWQSGKPEYFICYNTDDLHKAFKYYTKILANKIYD